MDNKTRHLSVADYFLIIQKEYLIAEFRRKIYFSKDRAYYQRVMDGKKKKILDISERNHLSDIFNSPDKLKEVRRELFDENGRPLFILTDIDVERYYAVGHEFSYKGDIWILDQISRNGKLVLYSPKLQVYEDADKKEVCRIL